MDDFDGDGLLDIAVTTMDPAGSMAIYRNRGDGTFEDRSEAAGVTGQFGGLVCYQTDYNNDGRLDVYHPPRRVASARRCGPSSCATTAGDGSPTSPRKPACSTRSIPTRPPGPITITTAGSTSSSPAKSNPIGCITIAATARFEEVAAKAGVDGKGQEFYKGCTWIDFDNDRYPDLFVNCMSGLARLYHNERDGSFTDVTGDMGIDGPRGGFACWSWDFDNDGWLDIFATSYDRSLNDVVRGLVGRTHSQGLAASLSQPRRQGIREQDRGIGPGHGLFRRWAATSATSTTTAGSTSTWAPATRTWARSCPIGCSRTYRGGRFAEITGTSGTGHLQKGHGVACGDWDNDGDVDIFIEMGGALNGDKYHNIMFQNPGQGNNWLTVKLVGTKTNRAAIGARIKVVTAGKEPLTIHRHITSGSSFGANPLRQTIGLAKADRVAVLQIDWPTSGTTQVFRDIPVNQSIEITELEKGYKTLKITAIPLPE